MLPIAERYVHTVSHLFHRNVQKRRVDVQTRHVQAVPCHIVERYVFYLSHLSSSVRQNEKTKTIDTREANRARVFYIVVRRFQHIKGYVHRVKRWDRPCAPVVEAKTSV